MVAAHCCFRYVLPNHMLLQIAETLPRDPQGILACCNPIPPIVRQNTNELHQIISAARELPLYKVTPLLKLQSVVASHEVDVKYDLLCVLTFIC